MDATLPWFGESAKSEAKAEEAQVQTELVQPTATSAVPWLHW